MRSIPLIILGSLTVAGLAACGADTESPLGPADLSQWCDFERPRQDCVLEEAIDVGEVSDIEAICASACTRAVQITFLNDGARALAGLQGFKQVDFLTISTNERGPENLVGLESLERVDWLEISGARSLKNLEGLNNVRHLGGEVVDPGTPSGLFIKDSSLSSLDGLDSLQTIYTLDISHAPITSLKPLEDVEVIDFLGISYTSISSIESIVISSPEFRAVNVASNQNLGSIPALAGVRKVTGVLFERNPKLSRCEIDAFVDGLDPRPEERWIQVADNKPCP